LVLQSPDIRLVSAQLTARCIDELVSLLALDACCGFSRAAQTVRNSTSIHVLLFITREPRPHWWATHTIT